eukprot:3730218-Karenia_brevis.AAC.1
MQRIYWAGHHACTCGDFGVKQNVWKTVLTWRGEAEWQLHRDYWLKLDSRNVMGWRRPRTGRRQPWEKQFVEQVGLHWIEVVAGTGRREWKAQRDGF